VTDYFCGQLMSELKCNGCGNQSISFNNFFDISVSFESTGYGAVDIMAMMQEYLKEEEIRDSYCAKEKRQRTCTKRL
jgi:ubiquitin C-terminal hydrolase